MKKGFIIAGIMAVVGLVVLWFESCKELCAITTEDFYSDDIE